MKQRRSESSVEELFLEYLRAKGIFAWKNPSAGYFDAKTKRFRPHKSKFALNGTADILGVLPNGRALAIEVKAPDNSKRSLHQAEFLKHVNQNNGAGFVASSLDELILNLHWRECA